jgi:hypothetical protein
VGGEALSNRDRPVHPRCGSRLPSRRLPAPGHWSNFAGPRSNWSLNSSLCDQSIMGIPEISGKVVQLRHAKKYRNATSRSKGRRGNDVYRVREDLTEAEMDKLLVALKCNRHGHANGSNGLTGSRGPMSLSMSVASRSWQVAPSGLEYRCRSVPKSNIGAIVRQTQIGAKNSVNVGTVRAGTFGASAISRYKRKNQIGIDSDRFLSPRLTASVCSS